MLAGLLTWEIAGTAAERRRRDRSALLRTRGASTRKLMQLALAETGAAGVVGAAAGLGIALLIGRSTFGTASFGAGTLAAALWAIGATVAGLVVAATAIALPALRDARAATIITQRRSVDRDQRPPLWARLYLDLVALAVAAVIYWQASQTGYTLVLAPEGLPQVSVNWYALLAPVLGWIGAGLFTYRIADFALGHSRRWLGTVLRPLTGALSPTVAAAITRQRRPIARVIALVALTGAFAASTAVFNATYRQQAEVDARLTNGADVTVTEPPGTRVGPAQARSLAATPGVASVEPLQHRFAYVGADLQDLFGVRPTTIGSAGRLQNAWFQGGSAAGLMRTLSQHPDSVLVSAETVRDFQLRPGDLVRLRLQDRATGRLTIVPFHYAGIAKEFPTAPTDSFLVANGDYVARMTGTDAVATFLIQTDGTSPTTVASRLRRDLGVTAKVTDITGSRRLVGSSLTAVELSGLTRIELGFAAILAVASTGLVLILGFQERRRTFAITRALGAGPRQLGGFIWSEALVTTGAGLIFGIITAGGLTFMLVKILTGVFDPPPDHLAVPWDYLAGVTAAVVTGVIAAGMITLIRLREPSVRDIRDV
ncbi:MAG: ABC transporter permease [Thermoleophilia bacterium]